MPTSPVTEHSHRGSVTAVALCWVAVIVGLAGLVADGGRVVSAHVRAADRAAAAARMGAQHLVGLRGGVPRIDCTEAVPVARAYMHRNGYDSVRVRCGETSLSVAATVVVPTSGLRVFGVGDRRVSVSREVRIVQE